MIFFLNVEFAMNKTNKVAAIKQSEVFLFLHILIKMKTFSKV